MQQTCTTKESCVDCTQYKDAFRCLEKIKVSEMNPATDLEIQTAFDSRCESILFPVSFKSCDKKFESKSIDLDKILTIIDGRIDETVSDEIDNLKKELEEEEEVEVGSEVTKNTVIRVNDGVPVTQDSIAEEFGWISIEGTGASTYQVEVTLQNSYVESPLVLLQTLGKAQGTKPLSMGDFNIPDTRPNNPVVSNPSPTKFQINIDLTFILPAGEWIGIGYRVNGQIS